MSASSFGLARRMFSGLRSLCTTFWSASTCAEGVHNLRDGASRPPVRARSAHSQCRCVARARFVCVRDSVNGREWTSNEGSNEGSSDGGKGGGRGEGRTPTRRRSATALSRRHSRCTSLSPARGVRAKTVGGRVLLRICRRLACHPIAFERRCRAQMRTTMRSNSSPPVTSSITRFIFLGSCAATTPRVRRGPHVADGNGRAGGRGEESEARAGEGARARGRGGAHRRSHTNERCICA